MAQDIAASYEALLRDGERLFVPAGAAPHQAQNREAGGVADQVEAAEAQGAGSQGSASEWLCDCGKWVPIGYSRHTHQQQLEPSLAEMIHQRRMHEAGLTRDEFPMPDKTFTVWREKRHETR